MASLAETLMKILFFYKGAENLGIEYLSSFLKSKGHKTALVFDPAIFSGDVFVNSASLDRFFDIQDDCVRAAGDGQPDLIAFSAYTGNYQWCLHLAKNIKKAFKAPIVFGGVHATAVPQKVLENDSVDYVIRGEGEYALLDLVEHLAKNRPPEECRNISNLGFKFNGDIIINPIRPYIQDLDSLPSPDKELFYEAAPVIQRNPYLIMTSRGCPYNCSYCCNNLIYELYRQKGPSVRRRSVDHVIAELEASKRKYSSESVAFLDDIFSFSKPWLEDFVPKYKSQVNLPFICNIHPLGFNKEIAFLLKDAGCYLAFLGIQSGSERVRKDIYLRKESNAMIVRAVGYLKEAGIPFNVDNIFGAPGETEEDLKKCYDFYVSLRPNILQSFWLTYYPGTHMVSVAQEKGLLSVADAENIDQGKIGFAHDSGSVEKKRISLYRKYELLFELITIFPPPILSFVANGVSWIHILFYISRPRTVSGRLRAVRFKEG